MSANLCDVTSDVCVSTSQSNKLRQGFITLAETLLESITDVFPKCDNSSAVLRIFRAIIKNNADAEDKFIWRTQALFKEYAHGIQSQDSDTLFNILEQLDYLRDINLREKWEDPDFTEDSKANLWQYVSALKTCADLYTAVPKNVMCKIENVAGTLGDQLVKGELNLKSMDIGALGQNLLSDLSAEELASFESKLPEMYESLSQVAGSLGTGNGANLDLSALMKQISKQEMSGDGGERRVDMTSIIQKLATQIPPGNQNAGNIDITQMLQTMGPLLGSLGSVNPSVSPPVSRQMIHDNSCNIEMQKKEK